MLETADRSVIWQAYTPQMFRLGALHRALADSLVADAVITDEASAMEWAGMAPRLIEGRADNLKVTRPEDLNGWVVAAGLTEARRSLTPVFGSFRQSFLQIIDQFAHLGRQMPLLWIKRPDGRIRWLMRSIAKSMPHRFSKALQHVIIRQVGITLRPVAPHPAPLAHCCNASFPGPSGKIPARSVPVARDQSYRSGNCDGLTPTNCGGAHNAPDRKVTRKETHASWCQAGGDQSRVLQATQADGQVQAFVHQIELPGVAQVRCRSAVADRAP